MPEQWFVTHNGIYPNSEDMRELLSELEKPQRAPPSQALYRGRLLTIIERRGTVFVELSAQGIAPFKMEKRQLEYSWIE